MMQYWFNPILSFYFVQCPWLVFRGNWTSKRSNLESRENLIIATNFSNQSHQKTSDDDDDQIEFDEHWSSSVFGEEIQGKSRKRLNTGCTFHDCLFFSSLGNESSNVDDDKEEEEKKGERSQETKSHSLRQKKQHTREIKRQNNLKAVLSGGSRLSLSLSSFSLLWLWTELTPGSTLFLFHLIVTVTSLFYSPSSFNHHRHPTLTWAKQQLHLFACMSLSLSLQVCFSSSSFKWPEKGKWQTSKNGRRRINNWEASTFHSWLILEIEEWTEKEGQWPQRKLLGFNIELLLQFNSKHWHTN